MSSSNCKGDSWADAACKGCCIGPTNNPITPDDEKECISTSRDCCAVNSDSDTDDTVSTRANSPPSFDESHPTIDEGPSRCFSPQPSVIQSSTSLSSIQSFPEYKPDSDLSIEEIRSRLSIHVGRRSKELITACKNYDSKNNGKITRYQLRAVLRTFCLPITLSQYEKLTERVRKDEKGRINFVNFFRSFRKFKVFKLNSEIVVDDTLTVDQIVLLIKTSVFPCLHDVIRSFWLFDYNKDGYVRRSEFKKVLQNYCLRMSDKQFADLWIRYGNRDTGLVKYTTFLKKIGVHCERIKNQLPDLIPKDTPLWEEPCTIMRRLDRNYADIRRRAILTGKNDPSIDGLTMDEVAKFFLSKLNRCGELLNRTLPMFDRLEDGLINIDELHAALNCFVMPMALGLFRDLLAKLKVEVKPISRAVHIQDFLKKFCAPDPEARRTEMLSAMKVSGAQNVVDDIKNKSLNPLEKLKNALNIEDNFSTSISKRKLRIILEQIMDCKFIMEDFDALMSFLDPKGSGFINCRTLLNMFDMRIENFQPVSPESLGLSPRFLSEQYKTLSGAKLVSRMKYHINKNRKSFNNALLACDHLNCKLVTIKQLRTVIDNFCFALTDEQFGELKPKFVMQGDRVEYETFLKLFEKTTDEDSKKWSDMIDKLSNFRTSLPTEVPVNEVEEMLKDAIRSKFNTLLRDFKVLDPCKMGFVYKDDVKAVLSRHVLRMTNAQFEYLWQKFPLNQHKCLRYETLLEKYAQRSEKMVSDEQKVKDGDQLMDEANASTSAMSTSSAKQKERFYVAPGVGIKEMPLTLPKGKKIQHPSGHKEFQDAVFATYPYLKSTYERLRPVIMKNFSILRQHIRRLDRDRTGNLKFQILREIIEIYGGKFTEDDVYHILEYFDPNLTGSVSHRDFMRLFAWYC